MMHSPAFLKLVDEAKRRITQTTPKHVKAKLEKKEQFRLIDVREASEWRNGHIKGAIHLSKGIIERDIEKTVPDKSAEVILYCGGGYRSALVADNLQKMGYANVVSMSGGWRKWIALDYPTK